MYVHVHTQIPWDCIKQYAIPQNLVESLRSFDKCHRCTDSPASEAIKAKEPTPRDSCIPQRELNNTFLMFEASSSHMVKTCWLPFWVMSALQLKPSPALLAVRDDGQHPAVQCRFFSDRLLGLKPSCPLKRGHCSPGNTYLSPQQAHTDWGTSTGRRASFWGTILKTYQTK